MQRNLADFMCRVENVLEFDAAVNPTEWDRMMFAKWYLVGNAAAAWDQHCAEHIEGDHI